MSLTSKQEKVGGQVYELGHIRKGFDLTKNCYHHILYLRLKQLWAYVIGNIEEEVPEGIVQAFRKLLEYDLGLSLKSNDIVVGDTGDNVRVLVKDVIIGFPLLVEFVYPLFNEL